MSGEVFLPKTAFPMRQRIGDDEIISKWNGLYQKLRQMSKDLPKFILQDGPPFANGKPHMGTAFNRVLKDIIIRFRQMYGYDAPFVPGWDCHGLPIEWKVEEEIRAEKKKAGQTYDRKSITDVASIIEFRARCREFAKYWINVQREGFKKLGTIADWDDPYLTMNPMSEGRIVEGILKLLSKGAIYRGFKPVMWSPVEQTALSDAEIEYKDVSSKSIYVGFKVKSSAISDFIGAYIVIWTTTPWTIPANRAISYSDAIEYSIIEYGGRRMVVATKLLESFVGDASMDDVHVIGVITGSQLNGTVCVHPLAQFGYDFDVPLISGEHVTDDSGTGFVHTAPGHGVEDFLVCKKYGIDVPLTVKGDGTYYDSVPMFAGLHVYKADVPVIEKLTEAGALFGQKDIVHSYPHSWRSKAPLIYITTEQWFIDLDKSGIRAKALEEIEKVTWVPEKGKNRIKSFVAGRGEWCISRQRMWGIPLMFFVNKSTREVLLDQEVFSNVVRIVEKEGSDAWYLRPNADFLTDRYNSDDYEKVFDIVDVWLESGSVYAYVTLSRPELAFPADLYLEGSDQHRGWFQSSLLTSVGTHGLAPYKSVLTHGFIVDESGHKMSKSLGNVIDPLDVIRDYGVDVIRMWVANSDYTEDMRIGPNILDQQRDLCRKFRNVLKYLLGATDRFYIEESLDYARMDLLERWCLARLAQVSVNIEKAVKEFNLRKVLAELKTFCFVDLSSFYFDVRKDCLYCDGKGTLKRRGYRTVLKAVYDNLVRWLAPIMAIASEEAWSHTNSEDSVHAQRITAVNTEYLDEDVLCQIGRAMKIRNVINTALERARESKEIGSNLQAAVILHSDGDLLFDEQYWAELCIVSSVAFSDATLVDNVFSQDGVSVKITKAGGEKCSRCWKYFDVVDSTGLCFRCANS